ncbi:MAG: hypothetical protein PSX37_07295, partial [bacterium]|nr:hypothetical protein [bacterium]
SRLSRRRGLDMRAEPIRPVAQAQAVASLGGEQPADVVMRQGFRPRVDEGPTGTTLRLEGVEHAVPADHAAALREITSGAPISASTLPGLDESSSLELLRALLIAGVVVPVLRD